MKTIKISLVALTLVSTLSANEILNDRQENILQNQEIKAQKEAELTKSSLINAISLEVKTQETKAANKDERENSKSASINFDQEIFKFGGIYKSIKKSDIEKKLNRTLSKQEQKDLVSKVYGYVINLKKIDLQIKQLYFQIENKKIEIKKNEDSYINGLIDITILDESVIELSSLKNQRDDLNIQKLDSLRDFKNLSDVHYKNVDLSFLSSIDIKSFLLNNKNIKIKELEYTKSDLDKDITASNYLPKLSVYGNYSYEDGDSYEKGDNSYFYGVKLSMNLDYSSSKNKEIAKLNKLIANENLKQTKQEEKSFFTYAINKLDFIDNKIQNSEKTLKRYKNLYKNVNALYENSLKTKDDVLIMENRMSSSILDKEIFEMDKKSIINSIYTRM